MNRDAKIFNKRLSKWRPTMSEPQLYVVTKWGIPGG